MKILIVGDVHAGASSKERIKEIIKNLPDDVDIEIKPDIEIKNSIEDVFSIKEISLLEEFQEMTRAEEMKAFNFEKEKPFDFCHGRTKKRF